jgi:hypothetical protein
MIKPIAAFLLLIATSILSCNSGKEGDRGNGRIYPQGTFGFDLNFLKQHDSGLVVLESDDGKSEAIVSPKYQAKVFTSTSNGMEGKSFGWVHYSAFSGPLDAHMNGYGGENRIWMGPEGGVYSLFFAPRDPMIFDNWHTPAPFDHQPWQLVSKEDRFSVTMHKQMRLKNYRGTELSLLVSRKVSLLSDSSIERQLGIGGIDSVRMVGYETDNTLTNDGNFSWTRKTGMPCIWILDMFNVSSNMVITIPFHPIKDKGQRIAKTDYFGQIPADRIKYGDSVLFFKADGKARGKIGLSPERAKGIAGSYDAVNNILTILTCDIDPDSLYLNQEWDTTGLPFGGDAQNAYNDGPLADGSQMGPFFEMESVSPAAMLSPGMSLSHRQTVYHFTGSRNVLDEITKRVLGISVEEIKNVF